MNYRRQRQCAECGKPLGSTAGKCYECGGSDASEPPGTETSYESAYRWKVWWLGLPREKVIEAHEESKKRNPKWDNEAEEWKSREEIYGSDS